jgi:hypothetical protein
VERLHPPEEFGQRDADLEARQVRAEAEVSPVSEREMRVGLAVDPEGIRLGEPVASRLAEPSQTTTLSPA